MYIEALAGPYPGEIVAWCDPNGVRMSFYEEALRAGGRRSPARYRPEQFDDLLARERPDVVIVTSPDHTHPAYEVPLPAESGHHGGADPRLLDAVLRPGRADPLGQRAGYVDGLRSVAIGLAANRSIATGQVVSVADLGLGFPLS